MPDNNDRCSQLRKLHASITEELRVLKEDERQEIEEGVENPLVISNIIKSLRASLNTIDLELQKCPPEA